MDIASMLKEIQEQKPPHDCPVCGKVYRSFSGISYHIVKFHSNPTVVTNNSPTASPATTPTTAESMTSSASVNQAKKQPLSYAEAQRMVEFDIKGNVFRNLITEPLEIEIEAEKDPNAVDDELENDAANCVNEPTPKKKKIRRKFSHFKSRYQESRRNRERLKAESLEEKAKLLPAPSFTLIPEEDVIETEVPERTSYYRFIEKSTDELDEEVEYGMDEEDYIWLEQVNEERSTNSLASVSQEVFEMLMDRLEKESHFESRTVTGDPYNLIDEDAVCSICADGECSNSNVILFCDMCNLAVHQECYGVPYIPEGQWLCRKCLQSPSKPATCVLCPSKSGAFKQTDTNEWAHVVCALWIPEVCFANTVFLEPIDSIQEIPAARWKLTCYICKIKEGACIQCFKTNCYTAFHVTCAQQGGLHMKIEPGRTETGAPTVKKSAYCDMHTPKHKLFPGCGTPGSEYCSEDESSDAGSIHSGPVHSPLLPQERASSPAHPSPSVKLKEVQKKLIEKESFKLPAVHIPFVPAHRLSKIVVKVAIPKKSQFIQQLQSYWMLKRQSRNGVPLLRRLQVNTASGTSRNQREELTMEEWGQSKELKEQLKYWQQLRHDLERVRLLIELIRKREKVKKAQYRMKQQVVHMQLKPLQLEMERTLMLLQERDTTGIFAEPVKPEDAPDYHEFISAPMDFSTMRQKLADYEYITFDMFENDFRLMVQNCLDFNKEDTVYYRAGVRMRSQCKYILKAAKKRIKQAGIDPQTGMHMEKPPISPADPLSPTEDAVGKDVIAILENPFMTIDDKIEDLEQKLDDSCSIKSALNRLARQKLLRKEIAKLRRQKRRLDVHSEDKSSTETENATEDGTPATTPLSEVSNQEKRGRKRKNGFLRPHDESSTYNGEVKIEPPPLSELRVDSTAVCVNLNQPENGDCNYDRLNPITIINKGGKVVTNPNPGRSRRSGILFKKKQYQPVRPSPLVLYSSATSDDDQNSLKIKLRVDHSSIENTSPPPTGNTTLATLCENLDKSNDELDDNVLSTPQKTNLSNDMVRLKDHLSPVNGHVNVNGIASHDGETDELTDDNDVDNSTNRKRTYTGSSSNSDSEETPSQQQRRSHKRGRQKNTKLSFKQEFSDLEGLDDIKCGIYMIYPDEAHLKDPKSHPDTISTLSLIWAKCRGYPSYPALTMDPKLPPGGYQVKGVPIPIPTKDILQMNDDDAKYLILFFDARRTWQWLPRDKIVPLGVDSRLDEHKLIESRKPSMRRNVQEAYKRAITFRRTLEVGERDDPEEDEPDPEDEEEEEEEEEEIEEEEEEEENEKENEDNVVSGAGEVAETACDDGDSNDKSLSCSGSIDTGTGDTDPPTTDPPPPTTIPVIST